MAQILLLSPVLYAAHALLSFSLPYGCTQRRPCSAYRRHSYLAPDGRPD